MYCEPRVSVIVPSYNHAQFIGARLESILAQTWTDFEVIILDDASNDASLDIIRSYMGDSRVSKIVVNVVNSGSPFAQWNRGIALARGELIWIAESDDLAEKDMLKRLVACFDNRPQMVLAYAQSLRIDSEGRVLGTWQDVIAPRKRELFVDDFHAPGDQLMEVGLLQQNLIPNASAVLFRRSIFEQVGGADVEIQKCSDWHLWCKMLSWGDVCFIAMPLNRFRRHPNSVIALSGGAAERFRYDEVFYQRLKSYWDAARPPDFEKLMRTWNLAYAARLISQGCFDVRTRRWAQGWVVFCSAWQLQNSWFRRFAMLSRFFLASIRGSLRGR